MRNISAISRAFWSLLFILALVSVNFLSLFLLTNTASAANLTSRKITIGSSKVSATDVTYSVSFNTPTGGTIKGIVVQFCSNTTGPIVGNACTGPAGLNINKATLVVANQKINGSTVSNTYTINANSDAHTLILTNATGNAASASQSVTFDMGSSGGSDGVTNPNATDSGCTASSCTFFARMLIYSNDTTAAAYTDTAPGAHIDDGSVALATTSQLTISARVQEVLQFCVGTTTVDDATTTVANDCSGVFAGNCGTSVNLGVLDSSVLSISPVPTALGLPGQGNGCNGAAMVRTNASLGVVVTYFAEQDTSSGKLKVVGASCSGVLTTDQCFNDSGTQGTFTAGTERFGITVAGTNCNNTTTISYTCSMSGGTNQLKATSNYIGKTLTTYCTACNTSDGGNGYAWNDAGIATPDQLASASGPVEDETLILKFAATPAVTTPSGIYTVTSTYIATATF